MTQTPVQVDDPAPRPVTTARSAVSTQIRGSTLLLGGRGISIGVNFAIQVMTVRYLTKSDFGAFAYALSLASLGENIVTFGLDRGVTRFVPLYEEREERDKLLGTLVLAVGTVVSMGLGLCLLVIGLEGWLRDTVISDAQAVTLLTILIVLAPLNAIDDLLMGLLAVFAKPKAIFFRRHVIGPGLRLLVVLLLVLRGAGVEFLAYGYVAGGVIAVAVYGGVLVRLLRRRGLLVRPSRSTVRIPTREILTFTIPLLSSELVYSVMNTSDVILLQRYAGAEDVAALRAVQPTARLNQVVFTSFTLLFTPLATRLFARDDRPGVNELYWQTALWLAVFSFPVFAITSSLAQPVTVTLFGDAYASSGVLLALLSIGYYSNAAMGFNGLTLKVYGAVRYVVILNIAAAVVNLALNFALIPRYGALGAAMGTAATLVVHNAFKQIGLRKGTGVRLFDARYLPVYVAIVVCGVALWVVQALLDPHVAVGLVLAGVASLGVFLVARRELNVAEIMPEVTRIPVIGRWLS